MSYIGTEKSVLLHHQYLYPLCWTLLPRSDLPFCCPRRNVCCYLMEIHLHAIQIQVSHICAKIITNSTRNCFNDAVPVIAFDTAYFQRERSDRNGL